MTYTAITIDNASDFPKGTVVEFNYGPMYGSERGTVTGFSTSRFGTQLTAVTEDGEPKTISGFSTIGIGIYLIGLAPQKRDTNSPWHMSA